MISGNSPQQMEAFTVQTPTQFNHKQTWLIQPIVVPYIENNQSSITTTAASSSKAMTPAKQFSVIKRTYRLSQSDVSEKDWAYENREESKVDSASSRDLTARPEKKRHPKYAITWTAKEDSQLIDLIKRHGENWNRISKAMVGKSEIKCYQRYLDLTNDSNKQKGQWTPEEDASLKKLVNAEGPKNWSKIAEHLPGRIGKQCRERWHNHLDPNINKTKWSPEEDALILNLHKEHGPKWCLIASKVPGRTDNAIKNRFNSNLKRQLKYGRVIGTYERVSGKRKPDQERSESEDLPLQSMEKQPSDSQGLELPNARKRDTKAQTKQLARPPKIFDSQEFRAQIETLQLSQRSCSAEKTSQESTLGGKADNLPRVQAIRLSHRQVYCVPDFTSHMPLMETLKQMLEKRTL